MAKGIDIISGFNVKSNTLLDQRNAKNTIAEMNAMENVADGLPCFCLEDKTIYIYYDGQWNPYNAGGGDSGAFTYKFNIALTGDDNNEDTYLIRT